MYNFFDYSEFSPEQILIYLRKSRSDDPMLTVEEVLQRHENILNEWCERNLNSLIPEENKYREVVSGETIKDRPEVQKVLTRIEAPTIKAILTVEVQRLSRGDLEDAGRLIKLLRYTNTLVITPQKTYDLRDEYDRDAFERELKRGNEFLEYQKKIMNRGRLLSVQQGNYIGSVAPYGYERTFVLEGKRKCPTLKFKDDEAAVVKMIFDMYVNQDMGCHNIAKHLDNLGIKPPKGDYWSPPAIKDMLSNIHYIGKVKWNWRKTVTIVEDGEILKTRPKSKIDDFLIYDGKHPAIIDEELFMAAQAKHGRNHRARATTKVRNPFAGIIYCQCGRAMSLRTYNKNGVERSAPRLLCDNQHNCHTSSCLFEEMEKLINGVLKECIEDFELKIESENKANNDFNTNLIKRLEAQLEELNRKEIRQWEKYSEDAMPKHIFDDLNTKVIQEKENVQDEITRLKSAIPNPKKYETKLCYFRDALNALNDDAVSPAAKNQFLKGCFERIEYKREKSVRLTNKMAGGKGILPVGGNWSTQPIEIDVTFRP